MRKKWQKAAKNGPVRFQEGCNLGGRRSKFLSVYQLSVVQDSYPYLEHVALFSAARSGKPIDNSLYMARSSLLAIVSTWASYTG